MIATMWLRQIAALHHALRAKLHFAISLAHPTQPSIRTSYTPASPPHVKGKSHSTAITKVATQENSQGCINNGYRRCP